MRVRTIHRHDNAYGDKYVKNPGKIYEHPSPGLLIDQGIVEDAAKPAARKERVEITPGE